MKTSFHRVYPRIIFIGLLILMTVIPFGSNALQVKQSSNGWVIVLALGEEAKVGPLLLGFESILGDSRCPIDALCLWEGDGAILVKASKWKAEPVWHPLHTHPSFGSEFEYEGYKIALTRLDPQPVVDHPIPPDEYRATLRITETSILPTGPSTWGRIKDLYR
ncbi:MAG: hypothetical protein GTO29_14280 [Candidatus Latescibacteria bacterium]|nr:hypothetical protein [Candidatus Latescibacterota bacterium]NIO57314.1 hypothetical protein [Candidatus Latescibacterota bacterium]